MKLLRLESEIGKCNFDCNLNDSLIIPPKSKIGLTSIAWEKNRTELTIDGSNNDFEIQIIDPVHGLSRLIAQMPIGTYSLVNINDFIDELEFSLNNACKTSIPKCIGLSFTCRENSSNKIVIETHQNKIIDPFREIGSTEKDYINIGVDNLGNNVYQKNGASNIYDTAIYGGDESYFFNTDLGCGIFRCEINELAPNTTEGFVIGLSSIEPKNMGNDFNFAINKYDFAIRASNRSEFYRYIFNDNGVKTEINSVIQPEIGDVIQISCNLGKIKGEVFQASGGGLILFNEEYKNGQAVLYPIIAFKDKTNCSIKKLRYTPFKEVESLGINEPVQSTSLCNFNFIIPTREAADFMGFRDLITTQFQSVNINIKASSTPEYFDRSETYIVELQTFSIDSYDMSESKQKRRDILSVINNSRDRLAADVLYEKDSPIMIDINNNNELIFRNLRMRVLNTDDEEISITNVCSAVLIIE